MSAEPGGVARLAAVLTAAARGAAPTPTELAELLWLARHAQPDPVAAPPAVPDTAPVRVDGPGGTPLPPVEPGVPLHLLPAPDRPPEPAGTAAPEAPARPLPAPEEPPARAAPAPVTRLPLRAVAPPMLPHPLPLQRALRPLARRVAAPHGHELDETATAERIARFADAPGQWLPVLRPARERWLRLHLVHDAGPTMPVWRPLVRDLRTALTRSGVFRTVEAYRLDPDGRVGGPGRTPVPVPADGRTVTLLVSDCTGPPWWSGPAGERWYRTLGRWLRRMPVAVLQPLPERLWRATALSPAAGLLSAPAAAAPNAALAFAPYDPVARPAPSTVPLPVLEVAPRWLAHWSALVADPGGGRFPGAVAGVAGRPLPTAADGPPRDDAAALPPEELVARFRATASAEAFRLAGHLALGTPRLPVMRLVHAALEPDPQPQHLAEVILSGMLSGDGAPVDGYAFRPGVREVLARSLPRSGRLRTRALLARVGALIDDRAGTAPGGVSAEARLPGPPGTGAADASGTGPVAVVSPDTLRYAPHPDGPPFRAGVTVGDRYRLRHPLRPGGALWRAHDRRTGQDVVVQPCAAGDRREFERTVRSLGELWHPSIVRVLDSGTHGTVPYAVLEHLDGLALDVLAAPSGFLLPSRLTTSVARGLASALTQLGERDLVHGAIGPHCVVVLPNGTPKLTGFALGTASGGDRRAEDLRRFAALLALLMSPDGGPEPRAELLTRLPPDVRVLTAGALAALRDGPRAERHAVLAWLGGLRSYRLRPPSEQYFQYRAMGPVRVGRTDLPWWAAWPDTPPPEPLDLGPPERTALLCALLLRPGRPVGHAELSAGLWGPGESPPDPRGRLAAHAAGLRRALGPGRLAVLPDGYALHTSADRADVHEFERLAAKAERLRADSAGAHEAARAALALWSGTPLAGVPGPAADAARDRLGALRLRLLEIRSETDLEQGRFTVAVDELSGLVAEHPRHVGFRRLHLTALDRAGRTAEARQAYRDLLAAGGRPDEELTERYRGPD
ncbi:SAV_2336 N-terminal domain-related protein [Streptomyces sp. LE64]|uniref:SAV_2336 N-terminal domain-related protein n=1 Tax=Streptomyces sp. LE64 TaxID=3448653 RepID=UPI004042E78D